MHVWLCGVQTWVVHVFTCVQHTCIDKCVHVCVGTRSWHLVSSLISVHIIYHDEISSWTESLPIEIVWLARSLAPEIPCFCLLNAGLQVGHHIRQLLLGFWASQLLIFILVKCFISWAISLAHYNCFKCSYRSQAWFCVHVIQHTQRVEAGDSV